MQSYRHSRDAFWRQLLLYGAAVTVYQNPPPPMETPKQLWRRIDF
ncbi:hypothetical protein [Alcaligenes faecalis]|nr:hypothetical protein [Alcaligenes faecalis]